MNRRFAALLIIVLLCALALPILAQDDGVVPVGASATITIPTDWVYTQEASGVSFASSAEAQQAFAGAIGTLVSGGSLDPASFPDDTAAGFIGYGQSLVAAVNTFLDTQEAAGAQVGQAEVSGRKSRTLTTTSQGIGFAAGVLEDGPNSLIALLVSNSNAAATDLENVLNSLTFVLPPASESPLTTVPVGNFATVDIPNAWVQDQDSQGMGVQFGVDADSIAYLQSLIARIFGQVTGAESTAESVAQPDKFAAGFIGALSPEQAQANNMGVDSLIAQGATPMEIDGRLAAFTVEPQDSFELAIGVIENGDQTLFLMIGGKQADLPEGGVATILNTLHFVEPAAK